MSDRIGFVGLGHMGAPMCEQLLRAGFDVTAFDLRADAVAAAVKHGAAGADSAAACAAAADVLVTMLPGQRRSKSCSWALAARWRRWNGARWSST
jgi:3-hydroxyisobutyrate dehydrogenase-like beta-hydroxyacid dehydrogenase